jgi:uncharacterized protein (TIGR02284 family)
MTNDDVTDVLNDLIETCKDGQFGFDACAKHTHSSELRSLFSARAEGCENAARELQELVVQYGGKPESSGSAAGALHRGWLAVRGSLTSQSDRSMLDECERGEDTALQRYRDALRQDLPASVRAVVERQCEGVERNHDMIKGLRDRFDAAV